MPDGQPGRSLEALQAAAPHSYPSGTHEDRAAEEFLAAIGKEAGSYARRSIRQEAEDIGQDVAMRALVNYDWWRAADRIAGATHTTAQWFINDRFRLPQTDPLPDDDSSASGAPRGSAPAPAPVGAPVSAESGAAFVVERADRLFAELSAAGATCLRHLEQCPRGEAVRGAVLATLSDSDVRVREPRARERRQGLDARRRRELERQERERAVGSESKRKQTVVREVTPCFDWWLYMALRNVDGFDPQWHRELYQGRASSQWPAPVPAKMGRSTDRYVQQVGEARFRVVRHFKLEPDGDWSAFKYRLRLVADRLQLANGDNKSREHEDLWTIVEVHMPAVAAKIMSEWKKGSL